MSRKAAAKPALQVAQVDVEALVPYARNARTHSDDQVAQIAASIREFGWTVPVLIDADGGIIAGHGRVLAARKLGLEQVPCIRLASLTEAQRRAYVIADNRIAMNAGWDAALLKLELETLQAGDFDMGLLGYSAGELAGAMGAESAPSTGSRAAFEYQEKYAVLIDCKNEADQAEAFNRLQSLGYVCKVLVN